MIMQERVKVDILIPNMELRQAETIAKVMLELIFYSDDATITSILSYEDIINGVRNLVRAVLKDKENAFLSATNNDDPDSYTVAHSVNVCILSILAADAISYNADEITEIAVSALLHDVGKRFIGKELILKKAPLTQNEMKWVCMHPALGAAYIQKIYPRASKNVIDGILCHHERLNGRGYPDGMTTDVPYVARVIAIADVFEAFTAKRPYHEKRTVLEGVEFLKKQEGLDDYIKDRFLSVFP